jgi:hypothetical protein
LAINAYIFRYMYRFAQANAFLPASLLLAGLLLLRR